METTKHPILLLLNVRAALKNNNPQQHALMELRELLSRSSPLPSPSEILISLNKYIKTSKLW